jgi:hypothetical protein
VGKDWRRRPDLNRGWRFCRPLPYHLATAPSELIGRKRPTRISWRDAPGNSVRRGGESQRSLLTARARNGQGIGPHLASRARPGSRPRSIRSNKWSGKRDSNPRLRPWQGRTLPLSYSRSLRTSTVAHGRGGLQGPTRGELCPAEAGRYLHALQAPAAGQIRTARNTRVASSGDVGLM